MPRTVSKLRNPLSDDRPNERAIKVEQTNWWEAVKRILSARETRMVAGVLLLAFAVIGTIAYVSFLFTGMYDQSILSLDHEGRVENREAIRNLLGLPGARLAHFMIDGTFGFVSVLLMLMIAIYGLRLMHVFRDIHAIKLFCGGTFWVLWGAVVLGFAQQMAHMGIYRWGGAFGGMTAAWLVSYVNIVGTMAILFVTLVIFLIVTDPRFIDRCKAFGEWCKGLFKKKPKDPKNSKEPEEQEEPEENQEVNPEENPEGNEVTIDLPVDFTIEPISEEEPKVEIEKPLVDEDNEPLGDAPIPMDEPEAQEESDKKDGDPNLEIEDVNEDELYTKDPDKLLEKLGPYDPRKDLEFYKFPSLNLLKVYDNEAAPIIDEDEQRANGARIVTTLRNYGIEIDSIKATVGPTVTLYEIVPKAGVRVAKIQQLENDIMLSLSATGIRIIAPMPGKGTVGIEVPNEKPQVVSMHSVIASKRFQEETKMRLPIAYGRTITNEVFMFDLAKTPHLLVAGATGTGKSVAINAIITSLLYKKHPAELKLVMVDPKMVEFAPYKPLIKHFLAAQPDTDP